MYEVFLGGYSTLNMIIDFLHRHVTCKYKKKTFPFHFRMPEKPPHASVNFFAIYGVLWNLHISIRRIFNSQFLFAQFEG